MSYPVTHYIADTQLLQQMGTFVKRRRIAAQKTQDQVAQEANLSRSTVSLLERGEAVTTITLLQVLRVIQALDVLEAFFEQSSPSPLVLLKEAKAVRERVRRTPEDDLLKPEW